jgi:hypothetical protein
MTQEEIAAAFTRIFGGLHPTPQDAFRAGVVVGQTPVQCTPGRHCARRARDLGACIAGECNPPASSDGVNASEALSIGDERILHLWDTHVAYETNAKRPQQPPLTDKDKLAFARAVIAASGECNPPGRAEGVKAVEPKWIVNDMGELGVMVEGRAYFLYKGDNIEYETGLHDDGTPILYRMVGKREFGETCQPLPHLRERWPGWLYLEPLVFTPGLSFGKPADGEWKTLPAAAKESPRV